MKTVVKFIKEYGLAFYLGSILSIAHLGVENWKWWVIVVPVLILTAWRGKS